MTYREATSYSNYLEGSIKCTYVRFYYDYGGKGNPDHIRHLFSLQHRVVPNWTAGIANLAALNSNVLDYKIITRTNVEAHGDGLMVCMTERNLGEYGLPVVEVRPSFQKEIIWGRKTPGTLVRVNIEATTLASMTNYFLPDDKNSGLSGLPILGQGEEKQTNPGDNNATEYVWKPVTSDIVAGRKYFYDIVDKLLDTKNLYVKDCAVDWQPMGVDVIEQAVAEEDKLYEEQLKKVQEQMTKYKRNLWLLGAAALLLNQ